MNLRNLLCLSIFFVNFAVADNRHLAPRDWTDEELEQQRQAQEQAAAVEAARIAQMQLNIIDFALAPHCDQAMIDLIQPYLQDQSIWNCLISLNDPADDTVGIDKVNIIQFVVMYGKIEQLNFLCDQLYRVGKLDFLNVPSRMKNKVPTTLCMDFEHWDCLITLLKFGAKSEELIIPEHIVTNPKTLKMCENAIAKGLKLRHSFLSKKKIKTETAEQKVRKKIEKLEAQAFEKIEDFYYGIDSGSDSDSN